MQELSLYILDIANNSIRANASVIDIAVEVMTDNNMLTISIQDNGCGMNQEMADNLASPYTTTRTTRNVGMGVALYNQLCCSCGGKVAVVSQLGKGTSIIGTLMLNSIDLLPMGDIVSTIIALITSNVDIDYTFVWRHDEQTYTFDTRQVKEVLEGIPLDNSQVIAFIRQELIENLQQFQEALYEVTQRARGY